MSLDPWVSGFGLTLGGAAISSLAGLALLPHLRSVLVPKPRLSQLSDRLSFDRVLPDNITLQSKDGSLTQTLFCEGIDTSIKTPSEILTLLQQKQRWLDLLSDLGATFKILTVRERTEHPMASGDVGPWLERIHERWMTRFSGVYRNRYYLVITHASGEPRGLPFGQKSQANIAKLKELVSVTLELLHPFCIRVLDNGEGNDSPLLSFWASVINAEPCPMAACTDHLSERLTANVVHFDPQKGLIRYQGGTVQFSQIVSLKSWGELSTEDLLNDVQALPCKLVIHQLYQGMSRLSAQAFVKYQQGQAQLLRRNETVEGEYRTALEHLSNQDASLYRYQLSIFLTADSERELSHQVTEVKKIFRQYGFAPVVETFAAETLWLSQFPGCDAMVRNTHPLSNNLAHLNRLHREPMGLARCDWGESPIRLFKTPTGGAYAFQFHITEAQEALGHSVVVAPAGSGKTTLFQHLIGGALRHPTLKAYIFDRFNGTRIFTQAVNGVVVDFADTDSALLNPFLCDDTEQNRAFLQQFLLTLAQCSDAESEDISARAVTLLFHLAPEERILKNLYHSLFDAQSLLKTGLKKWALDNSHARWFNGTKLRHGKPLAFDALDLTASRLVTFEMTDVQASAESAAAVTLYIMHRIRTLARETAAPHLIFIDETKPMLMEPTFTQQVSTLLLEHRKLRGSVNLCFQEANAIAASSIAPIILEQCPTRFLFPNPAANAADYAIFDLTESEWLYIKGQHRVSKTLKHSALLKRTHESVILDIDLSSLGPLLRLYRSGSEPVRLVRELQQQWGAQWVEPYLL